MGAIWLEGHEVDECEWVTLRPWWAFWRGPEDGLRYVGKVMCRCYEAAA